MRVQLMPLRSAARSEKRCAPAPRRFRACAGPCRAAPARRSAPDAALQPARYCLRTSADSPRSVMASETRANSSPESSTPTTADATSIARSRRNGWLARLIGIFIVLQLFPSYSTDATADNPAAPRYSPRASQRRPQRLHFHAKFSRERRPRFVQCAAETAQQQPLGLAPRLSSMYTKVG